MIYLKRFNENYTKYLKFEDLPKHAQKDIEFIYSDEDIENYFYDSGLHHDDIRWYLEEIPIIDALEYLDDNLQYDDNFMEYCEKLSKKISKSKRIDPPIEKPLGGVEGRHRIMACNLIGRKTIPIYKIKLPDSE